MAIEKIKNKYYREKLHLELEFDALSMRERKTVQKMQETEDILRHVLKNYEMGDEYLPDGLKISHRMEAEIRDYVKKQKKELENNMEIIDQNYRQTLRTLENKK